MNGEIIPIDALFGDDHRTPNPAAPVAKLLAEADIIVGIDVMTQNEFLLFGQERLQAIVESSIEEELRIVRIGLDQETDELEKACALMLVTKGRCDYQNGES